ncbi:MAG: hypothetical protein CMG59_04350 [Candidatus Marinimicrobia bacterium]|nr:hypothetical protein [Candidatus Neomarinimicrobiota bacterium]|tara:strand:- start:888 stop:1520 length:633 start_codon:yes stop_codon:yes gene_type:complete
MKDLKENKKNRFFLKGIAFILPVFLTCWILYSIMIFMSNLVPSWIVLSLISLIDIQSESAENIVTTILGFILTLLLIQLSGMVFSVIGKKFFDKIEDRFLFKIPIFSTIYKTIKQIVDTVSNPDKNSFKKVVMVEFPRKGVWTIGFVTGESVDKNNNEYYHIIVPTTPNPTSAYLLFVLKDDVKGTDLTIDEGIKTIISGGVLSSKKNYI